MKNIRRIICLLFVVSCAVTALYYVKVKMVEDTTPPVITCETDSITVSVKDDPALLMQGLTAKDNRDGDLTEAIRVDSMAHFVSGHKRTVNYVVFDHANLVGTASRTVIYSDYTPTKIKVKAPFLYLDRDMANVNLSEYVVAKDCLDGVISNQVRTIFGNDYYGESGTYDLTLEVSNSAGDVRTLPMEITILDTEDDSQMSKAYPLLSDYVLYTKVGKPVDAKKYLKGLWIGGRDYRFGDVNLFEVSADDVNISTKDVDYKKPGMYTITYSYTAEGAKKAETKCYVVVEEQDNE